MPLRKSAEEKALETLEERRTIYVEKARAALARGDSFFELWVSGTHQPYRQGEWEGPATSLLGDIEAVGWRLEHAGYSRQESEYVSVYLFRRQPSPDTPTWRLRGGGAATRQVGASEPQT